MGSTELTVLFVDDDAILTEMACDGLPPKGFIVHVAHSSEEAISLIEKGLIPDVLCADIVMPGGTGVSLAKTVQSMVPSIKIILMTGNDEQVLPHNTRSGFTVLGKPFLLSTLARKLHELVDTPMPI